MRRDMILDIGIYHHRENHQPNDGHFATTAISYSYICPELWLLYFLVVMNGLR